MADKDTLILLLLILSLILFPVLAFQNKHSSSLLFYGIFGVVILMSLKNDMEKYDRMDFFPWNEANLVKKRDPNSTVIDCAWYLDKNKSDNIFKLSDPVIAPYDNTPVE